MHRIRWTEKTITFQSLVDNPAIKKPALVQIGTKLVIVGEKITGEFITAAPCRVSNDRFNPNDHEIVLSSKHPGVWKILSKSSSKKEGHIQRLTTKDIEKLYEKDVKSDRQRPRVYVCTKDIEAFEFLPRSKDGNVEGGYRTERRRITIQENMEFEIRETGETEYTPRESERTTQDYVKEYRKTTMPLLQIIIPGFRDEIQLIRNRVLRSLKCVTKNESHRRYFFLEVNENPCEIRPIASDGSSELRYLQSTQNLFNYMLNYGNDTSLYVKVFRGEPPLKAVEYDGHMVFRNALDGDRVPICRVENLELSLVSSDLSVRVKLPTNESAWHSLPEVLAAERQCMQLPLSLLSRHESETYVIVESDRDTVSHLQSSNDYGLQSPVSRSSLSTIRKSVVGRENKYDNQSSASQTQYNRQSVNTELMRVGSVDESKMSKVSTSNVTSTQSFVYPMTEKPIRYDEKRPVSTHVKSEVPRYEQGERRHQSQRISTREYPKSSTSTSASSFSQNQTTRTFVP